MLTLPCYGLVLILILPVEVFPETVCPSPPAFNLRIGNVSLADKVLRRGVQLSIGNQSSEQTLAFQLSCELNNTYIFGHRPQSILGGCNGSETVDCIAQVGGIFKSDTSPTWFQHTDMTTLSTASEHPLINPNHTADLWGTDILRVTDQKGLPSFPLGISRGQGESMNTLGLGRNSTLINALVDSGAIAARTWAFWQGWTGAEQQHQIDGGLVLGGYDTQKFTGPNITLPTSAPDNLITDCFLATITDIKMNLRNGSSPSLFGSNKATAARACVEPHFNTLSFSHTLWEKFLSISGSTYVGRSNSVFAFYGMLIETDGAYDGDLTISLDPGLDITIPNHQLVVPDYHIDSKGQTYIKNDSNREVLINSLQEINENDGFVLGLPFFTSAYMMVDNDRKQFTLWQSQATAKQNLISAPAFNCSNTSTAAVPSITPSTSAIPSAGGGPVNSSSITKGTIAGAVVGALAGVALVFSGFFFLLKRTRAQAQRNKNTENSSHSASPILYKPELASDRQPPQEMPLARDPGYTTAPHEMLEERLYHELPAKGPVTVPHEMPAATPRRGREFELPGLPSSPRPGRKK